MAASQPDTTESRDALLGQVIGEIFDRLTAGEKPDLATYVQKYPTIADLLRKSVPPLIAISSIGSDALSAPAAIESEGQRQLGDFRIVREIGRGGMGVVYEAEQMSMRRRVALKVLPFASLLDPKALRRFQNEVRAAATLDHPNIVPVYSTGCERGVHYYAMRYIDGETLAHLVDTLTDREQSQRAASSSTHAPTSQAHHDRDTDDRPIADSKGSGRPSAPRSVAVAALQQFSPSDTTTRRTREKRGFVDAVAKLCIDVARALDYAHQHGIVHRDVKPSNLMLDVEGKVWITDFGLAQFETDANLTATGDMLGTLRYMSPEQVRAERAIVDHRTDIYSLGATLYELLTLRPVFDGQDREQLLHQITSEEPRSPRRVNRCIPIDLETIVLKALAKDASERYATAQKLAEDLDRFLNDQPILAKRQSLLHRIGKWARRHRSLVGLLIAFLLATSIMFAISAVLIARKGHIAEMERAEAVRQRREVVRRETSLRRHVHAADLRLACEALSAGQASQARQLLDKCLLADGEHDARSFALYYLASLMCGTSREFCRHADAVYHLAYSPDGRVLASGGVDRVIVLRDVATGKVLETLKGHTDDVNFVAFSHDAEMLVSAGEDKTVRLWDLRSGNELRRLSGFQQPVALALLTPDDQTLIAAEVDWPSGASRTTLWAVATGELKETIEGRRALALAPDGQQLAVSARDGSVGLLDLDTLESRTILKGVPREIIAGAFSPDGRLLAVGGRNYRVRVLDLVDGHELGVSPMHLASVRSIVFSPDGQLMASVGDESSIRLWSPLTGCIQSLQSSGHSQEVWAAAFSPDGRTLATTGKDGSVRLSRVPTLLPWVIVHDHLVTPQAVAFLPDNKMLAAIDARGVHFWDTETRTPSGRFVAERYPFSRLALSSVRSTMALGTLGGEIYLLDVATRRVLRKISSVEGMLAWLAFSPDGRHLGSTIRLSSCQADTCLIQIWDVSSGEELFRLDQLVTEFHYSNGAFSPDGRMLLSWHRDREFQSIDLATWEVSHLQFGEGSIVSELAFSPDGNAVAYTDGFARLFDSDTLRERAVLLGHGSHAKALAFSPDGKVLATGGFFGKVILWDACTGRELMTIKNTDTQVVDLAFSPDGTRLAALCGEETGPTEIIVWYAPRTDSTCHEQAATRTARAEQR